MGSLRVGGAGSPPHPSPLPHAARPIRAHTHNVQIQPAVGLRIAPMLDKLDGTGAQHESPIQLPTVRFDTCGAARVQPSVATQPKKCLRRPTEPQGAIRAKWAAKQLARSMPLAPCGGGATYCTSISLAAKGSFCQDLQPEGSRH